MSHEITPPAIWAHALTGHSLDEESSHSDCEWFEWLCAPATVLELITVVDGVHHPAPRVVAGTTPQEVFCR